MINILFDCPNLDDFKEDLREYIKPTDKVAVVTFSYYDDYVYDDTTWQKVYGEGGNCYIETVEPLGAFGIPRENISFINYFKDKKEDAIRIIEESDAVYFTGGLPDRMMERIEDFGILDVLLRYTGTVIGYSAGAVIQMREYHLTPDADYSEFAYYKGLGYLDGFSIEVHYEKKAVQDESIKRVLREKGNTVFVTYTREGGIVVKDGEIITVGHVDVYEP